MQCIFFFKFPMCVRALPPSRSLSPRLVCIGDAVLIFSVVASGWVVEPEPPLSLPIKPIPSAPLLSNPLPHEHKSEAFLYLYLHSRAAE